MQTNTRQTEGSNAAIMTSTFGLWEKRLAGAVVLLLIAPLASLALLRTFYTFDGYDEIATKVADLNNEVAGAPKLTIGETLAKTFVLNGDITWAAALMIATILLALLALVLGGNRVMRRAEALSWLLVFFVFLGPLGFLAVLNGLNVAFGISVVLLVAGGIGVFLYGQRRPEGQPTTWGEAFLGAAIVFVLLGLAYGIVPNQFLAWADNELQWRKDKIGLPTPTGLKLFSNGIDTLFFLGEGRGRIIITKEAVRDVIVSTIYVFGIVANFMMWAWWQRRNKASIAAASKEIEVTSAFGRPLVRST